jgi:hypothetical protein
VDWRDEVSKRGHNGALAVAQFDKGGSICSLRLEGGNLAFEGINLQLGVFNEALDFCL